MFEEKQNEELLFHYFGYNTVEKGVYLQVKRKKEKY
jgi:hypothetical protein